MKKNREFLNSDRLIYNLAGFLKCTLLMFPVPDEDKAKYEEEIRELFERVAKNSETEWQIRGSALYNGCPLLTFAKSEEALTALADKELGKTVLFTDRDDFSD